MPLSSLVWFGIDAALDHGLGAIGSLTRNRAALLIRKVNDHFTLSSQDLALAFQGSFQKGVSAIALGVAPSGLLGSALAAPGTLLSSKLAKEFAATVEQRYLGPFLEARGLDDLGQRRLRRDVVTTCRRLETKSGDILPASGFPDGRQAADLLRDSRTGDIARLIVAQIGQSGVVLPADVIDFLTFEGLIGDAVLYFVREALRRNERVERTLNALRQEGLWDEVAQSRTRLDQFAERLAHVSQLWAADQAAVRGVLGAIDRKLADEFAALASRVADVQDQSDEILAVVRDVQAMMKAAGRGDDVKVADAIAPISGGSAGLIEKARSLLVNADPRAAAHVPGAANTVAAALISTGDERRAAEAERLLEEAFANTTDDGEKARAAYNLYQVRLLRRDFDAALGPLQAALSLDLRRYSPTVLIGGSVPKYRVGRILGAGGMGCVYLCRDPVRGCDVAVKTLWQTKPGPPEQVFAEFQAMTAVGGAIVPRALDFDISPGTGEPYVVMEYLDGYLDGEAWLDAHGALSAADTAAIGTEIARALAAAHGRTVNGAAAPIPHLDLKPANIMLRREDDRLAVKLIDWGLARFAVALGAAATPGTRPGTTQLGRMVMGTWDYAPPEQMGKDHLGPPGPKSDIYALGKTLYRLATGSDPHSLSRRQLRGLGDLADVIQDCTEERPDDRPSAADLVDALAAPGRGRATEPAPPPAPPRPEPAPPPPPPAKPTVETLEGTWPNAKCVFRDWDPDGRSDPTLPQMVVIPPGRFTMGSPPDEPERVDREGPQHEVTIARPFALGRYAVTQAEWSAVMGDNPSWFKGDRNPVECVSWNDAKAFLKKLNAKLGLSEQAGYRLPSEAEWEYACRAGTTTPFWWGSTITTDQANYDGNRTYSGGKEGKYREKTVPVDEFEPNPWGLYQVHGNVWEWCEDCWNDTYQGAPSDGSAWTTGDCEARVLRGGSRVYYPLRVRSAYRIRNSADGRGNVVGFRLARTFPLES